MWPFRSNPNPREQAWRQEYEADRLKMREPQLVRQENEYEVFRKVSQVLNNGEGTIGVKIADGYHSCAIHEITKAGEFSKKGPYWTKKKWVGNPRQFGIFLFAVSRVPHGMRAPSQEIRAYGLLVEDLTTDLLPPMAFSDWQLFSGKF